MQRVPAIGCADLYFGTRPGAAVRGIHPISIVKASDGPTEWLVLGEQINLCTASTRAAPDGRLFRERSPKRPLGSETCRKT